MPSGSLTELVLSGRRTPTRQSACGATRTTVYDLILYIRHAEKSGFLKWVNRLDSNRHNVAQSPRLPILVVLNFRGRTGFDLKFEAQAACRGWFVGLVKNRAKKNKRRSPRSRSRGLIDRDVWSWTPATAPNVDSRLIVRRSDRVGR